MKKLLFLIFLIFILPQCHLKALNISTPELQDIELYPEEKPYHEDYLQVSDLHKIYYCEFGNPKGIPVLVVHGGPGWGCPHSWSHFFDLSLYHVIMFDQRGSMCSIPFAEMQDNTPQHLIEDMEKIRSHLGIKQWYLFGGSWGSTLSLLYSEEHPDNVLGLVLRGIFLGREKDYSHLFYGMRETFPEAWDEMIDTIGETEQCDLISSFHNKVMNKDPSIHLKAAHAFMKFDTICAFLLPNKKAVLSTQKNDTQTLSVARTFIHYSTNHFFIEENQLLANSHKIKDIPTIIVQGRYDLICPMRQAYELHKTLPKSSYG